MEKKDPLRMMLNRLKKNNFKSITNPEELRFLKEYVEKYSQPTFVEKLKEFESTYREHPKYSGKRLDGKESALYKALNKLKKTNFKTITNPEELKFLKEYVKKYRHPPFIEELKKFEATYREYPKNYGIRLNGREEILRRRLNRLKEINFKTIADPEELKFLRGYVEKYRQPTFIEEIKEFDSTYGEYPKYRGGRLGGREGAIHAALYRLKNTDFKKIKNLAELSFLKEYVEKYRQPTLIEELKKFEATYHEYPKAKGKRLDGREGAIYTTLYKLKKAILKQ